MSLLRTKQKPRAYAHLTLRSSEAYVRAHESNAANEALRDDKATKSRRTFHESAVLSLSSLRARDLGCMRQKDGRPPRLLGLHNHASVCCHSLGIRVIVSKRIGNKGFRG